MGQLRWTPDLSVGVEEFDNQHKQIFATIIEVRKLISEMDYDQPKIKDIIDRLINYASFHLNREVELFEMYKWKYTKHHIKKHLLYKKKVDKFTKMDFNEKSLGELLSFLEFWWIDHIQKEDKKYTDFFHEKGVY